MRRKTNIIGLKMILRGNTTAQYLDEQGIANDDFYIHLTDGQRYLVKKGYGVVWINESKISIFEINDSVRKNAKRRSEELGGGFLEGLLNMAMTGFEAYHSSNTVEIDWSEIREIEDIS